MFSALAWGLVGAWWTVGCIWLGWEMRKAADDAGR